MKWMSNSNTTMTYLVPSILTFGLLPSFFSAVMPYGDSPVAGQNNEAFAERTYLYVGGQYINTTFVSLALSEMSGSTAKQFIATRDAGGPVHGWSDVCGMSYSTDYPPRAPSGVHSWLCADCYRKFEPCSLPSALGIGT